MSDDSDSTAERTPDSDNRPEDEQPAAAGEKPTDAESSGDGEQQETSELSVEPSVVERVAEHDDELAASVESLLETAEELDEEVTELEAELADRETEVEDLKARLKRKQADFQNYKKRRKRKEEEIRERATENLVERLVGVRDNLRRALEDDHDDVEGLREGVKMTLAEFDRVLDAEDVEEIAPEPGSEVDPQRHEVMMRVDSDQPADTIADVYEPGYEMAGKVLRAAKVTVSDDVDE